MDYYQQESVCLCVNLRQSVRMHVCIGLHEQHGCLGDSRAHFHVFEQSYESFHARYRSVFLFFIFLILWTLDMDNLGRCHFLPFSPISYPSILIALLPFLAVFLFVTLHYPRVRQSNAVNDSAGLHFCILFRCTVVDECAEKTWNYKLILSGTILI